MLLARLFVADPVNVSPIPPVERIQPLLTIVKRLRVTKNNEHYFGLSLPRLVCFANK